MSKILTNNTGSAIPIADVGVTLAIALPYTIPPQDYLLWSASSDILSPVGNNDVTVNDGSDDLSPSDGIDLLKGITASSLVSSFIVANLSMIIANTEYFYVLPVNCRAFEVQTRNASKVQLSNISGQSNVTYVTIPAGATYSKSNRKTGAALTLYVQASKPNEILEIIYWI